MCQSVPGQDTEPPRCSKTSSTEAAQANGEGASPESGDMLQLLFPRMCCSLLLTIYTTNSVCFLLRIIVFCVFTARCFFLETGLPSCVDGFVEENLETQQNWNTDLKMKKKSSHVWPLNH